MREEKEEASMWQPIETAPDDGTEFIGGWFFRDNFLVDVCKFYARPDGRNKIIQARYRHRLDPTVWMSLPPAPQVRP